MLIAFADADEIPRLEDATGLGGSSYTEDINGQRTYVSGQIALHQDDWNDFPDRYHGREHVKATVMHELGHGLGLAHVSDSNEIMYKNGHGRTDYGPGDRRGLATLGEGPCT